MSHAVQTHPGKARQTPVTVWRRRFTELPRTSVDATSSSWGPMVSVDQDPANLSISLTRPGVDFGDEQTRFSFKPSTHALETELVQSALGLLDAMTSIPFRREIEAEGD